MTDKAATFAFLEYLDGITQEDKIILFEAIAGIIKEDSAGLKKAAVSYGDSWKSRGGAGAFMQFCRKFDRMEVALDPAKWPSDYAACNAEQKAALAPMSRWAGVTVPAWDIFAGLAADQRPEGLLDDVRDLRRYLLLVEAEMRARGVVQANNHRDNK